MAQGRAIALCRPLLVVVDGGNRPALSRPSATPSAPSTSPAAVAGAPGWSRPSCRSSSLTPGTRGGCQGTLEALKEPLAGLARGGCINTAFIGAVQCRHAPAPLLVDAPLPGCSPSRTRPSRRGCTSWAVCTISAVRRAPGMPIAGSNAPPPAIAAGLTDHVWTLTELLTSKAPPPRGPLPFSAADAPNSSKLLLTAGRLTPRLTVVLPRRLLRPNNWSHFGHSASPAEIAALCNLRLACFEGALTFISIALQSKT